MLFTPHGKGPLMAEPCHDQSTTPELRFLMAKGAVTMSLSSAAMALGMSPKGLRNVIAECYDFPPRLPIGKRQHVLVRDLDAWIARRYDASAGQHNRAA